MRTTYTVETYGGERCVVGRERGIIVETYACGDLPRKDAIAMARGLAAEQKQIEMARELEE